ncbi:DEAD/DEAH box helicase [Mycoplasma sp. E35C]|uniref:DEAD/DEAH box helicase n=1 Tax=Mycoplasma sp. E35C TaxID=2801918 RepID=UPI001CA45F08|nr:DEAD/DEAH box helicase [Mycoplasma sp. E35C]QZX49096.1 DEAD/DEAH box helicase [Mycoplasma sp. E35C]
MINKILEYYFQDSELVRGKNLVNRKTVNLKYVQKDNDLILKSLIQDDEQQIAASVSLDLKTEKLYDLQCSCDYAEYCRHIAGTLFAAYLKLKETFDQEEKNNKKQEILLNNKIRETRINNATKAWFSIESLKKSFNSTRLAIFLNVDDYKFKLVNENYFLLKQDWMNKNEVSFYVSYEKVKTPVKLIKLKLDSDLFKYQDLYMFWYLIYLSNLTSLNDEPFLKEGSYLNSDIRISNPNMYGLNNVDSFKEFLLRYDQSNYSPDEDLVDEILSCFNECTFINSAKKSDNKIVLTNIKGDVYQLSLQTFVDKKWVDYLSHYLSKDHKLILNTFNSVLDDKQLNHDDLKKVSITSKEFLDLYISLTKLGFEKIYLDNQKESVELVNYLPRAVLFLGFDNKKNAAIINLVFNYKRDKKNHIVYYGEKNNLNNQRMFLYEENIYDFFFKKVVDKKLLSRLKKNLVSYDDLNELKNLSDKFSKNDHFQIKLLDSFVKEQKLIFNIKNFKKIESNDHLIKLSLEDFNYDLAFIKDIVSSYLLSKEVYVSSNGYYNLQDPDNQEFLQFWSKFDFYGIKKINNKTLIFNKYRLLDLYNAFKNYDAYFHQIADKDIIELIDGVFNNTFNKNIKINEPFNKILWPYQQEGHKWLRTMQKFGFGAIMADDMGLGKTIQTISVISQYYQDNPKETKQSLIVAPTSLLLNWANEFKKFAPNLNISIITGKGVNRKEIINSNDHLVEITTYSSFRRDKAFHVKKDYAFIVLDEAQSIKNASSILSKEIKGLKGAYKIALTGTVIENRLSELWSIFDFVLPGFFGSISDFNMNYTSSIERDERMNQEAIDRLKKKIRPFILRRTKEKVLKDLPPKTQTDLLVELSDEHMNFYRQRESIIKEQILEIIKSDGNSKKGLGILLAKLLNELRQICCSPRLIDPNVSCENIKFNAVMDIVNNAMKNNKKILLFSQYLGVIDQFKKELSAKGINYFVLTGDTPKEVRLQYVNEFNNLNKPAVFIASLKAGGVGLNLTGAEIVIHYDLWWNLALQNQATDRAHRIGQKNHVHVYRIIAANTIEERIVAIQERKKELASKLIQETDNSLSWLNVKDILSLFE